MPALAPQVHWIGWEAALDDVITTGDSHGWSAMGARHSSHFRCGKLTWASWGEGWFFFKSIKIK